jgi:hypothetical protein
MFAGGAGKTTDVSADVALVRRPREGFEERAARGGLACGAHAVTVTSSLEPTSVDLTL